MKPSASNRFASALAGVRGLQLRVLALRVVGASHSLRARDAGVEE